MQQLNRHQTHSNLHRPLRVLQFGGGNFLRAFVNWMVQELNEQTDFNGAVAVVKPTKSGDYSTMRLQEGLFTVVLDGVKNGSMTTSTTLVDCVQTIVNPYTEWQTFLRLAKNPDIRIITSNTTEAGIRFDSLNRFDATPPKEFPAKLTLWLYQRFLHFKGDSAKGCILLPCELIENNGDRLKRCLLQYAELWNLDPAFSLWITSANRFCNTLVDRIVSGYPKDSAAEIQAKLGYKDALLVAGEYYHSWVIEGGPDVQEALPFQHTNLNVTFVQEVRPYRDMKVRILNGAHTAMVAVGYLKGHRTVNDVMQDDLVSDFIESLLRKEVVATLDMPHPVLNRFIGDVLDRFRNTVLQHQLISISLNSTAKFVSRLLPTFKAYYASTARIPRHIVFVLAALIRFYKGEIKGEKIALADAKDILDIFSELWTKYDCKQLTMKELIVAILGNHSIWGEDLTKFDGLVEAVVLNLEVIARDGIVSPLKTIANDH